MAGRVSGALEVACERRFPAWTLYARTFSGNRGDADYLVRNAVTCARKSTARLETEIQVHEQVLSSIRACALRSPPASAPAGSVLRLLGEPFALETAKTNAARRLKELPRDCRRSIERVLLSRPSWSLEKLAAHEGVPSASVTAALERCIHSVAEGVRRQSRELSTNTTDSHPALAELLAYVQGARGADEARGLASHGSSCAWCGDRLGTLILLRAAAIESFRLPQLPRGASRFLSVLLASALLATAIIVARGMMPNPWKEHATQESVPRWFYPFLYRGEGAGSGSDMARGLSLVIEGRYEEAIEVLEPLALGRDANAEAETYLGIARYLTGDSSRETLRLLESGTSSSRAGRLARWYLANVLLTRGDIEGATAHLTELATLRDWFGRAAAALLEELGKAKEPVGSLAVGWGVRSAGETESPFSS
jgi:hypothetical protein